MEKVMYIPKGQTVAFDNLYCENLIVLGTLIVRGRLVARNIRSTKGHICASSISAKSLVGNTVDADVIVVDRLIANQVDALEIRVTENMAASSFVKADLLKAGKVTLADSEIGDLQSDDVTYLTAKKRGLLGTLFASSMRAFWFYLSGQGVEPVADEEETVKEPEAEASSEATAEADTTPSDETAPETTEGSILSDDEEFLRIKMMYIVAKEAGYTLQLIPSEPQPDGAANPDFQFAVPADKDAA